MKLLQTPSMILKFKFLRNEYKSYYSKEDLQIYSECRTVANTGILHCNQNIANTVEIDVSKAYSAAVTKILMIPIFTIFDKWQEYSGEDIKNFHLYVVESKEFDTFFNKSNYLCYGQFLKYCPKDEIIIKYVKKPSWVIPVIFKELLDELYETYMSDNQHENNQVQKQ